MNDKREQLAKLGAEMQRWDALLVSLDDSVITAPNLPGGWSIKDVVAHLHAWQQRTLARVAAALSGGEPEYPPWPTHLDPEQEDQVQELNDWLYQASRASDWPAVYGAWRTTFQRLLDLAQAVPDTDLLHTGTFPWLEGYPLSFVLQASGEHHAEHWEWLMAYLREHDLAP